MQRHIIFGYVWLLKHVRARAGAILVSMFVAVTLAGVWAFTVEGRRRGDPMGLGEALYSTLGLFAFAGNRFGYPQTAALRTVYFLASYVTLSAILEAALRILPNPNAVLLAGIRGHTVICGAGGVGGLVAGHYGRQRMPTVLVNNTPLAEDEGDALLVVGDMSHARTLDEARVAGAGKVYLTAGDDLLNLEVATRLAEGSPHRTEEGPAIFCHVGDAALRESLLDKQGLRRPITYFNSYRLAAKALVAKLFAEGWIPSVQVAPNAFLVRRDGQFALVPAPEGALPPLVVVVGLGRFGRAVAEQLKEMLPAGVPLRVVDRDRRTVLTVKARLGDRVDVRQASIASSKWREGFAEPPPDGVPRALVLLCTDRDRENLRVAMELARTARTVVRLFDQERGERISGKLSEAHAQIDPVGFRRLFDDAFPMLAHQQLVAGPDGPTQRIRGCLRLQPAGERWYLVWLDSPAQAVAARAGEAHAVQVKSLGSCPVPTELWLVRSGVLERLPAARPSGGSAR